MQPLIFAAAGAVLIGIHIVLLIRAVRLGGHVDSSGLTTRRDIVWIALPGVLALALLYYTVRSL